MSDQQQQYKPTRRHQSAPVGLAVAVKFSADESKRLVAVSRSLGEESFTRTLKKLVDEKYESLS